MKNKGFTLVELLAVIGILVVLLLIAVPTYQNVRKNINESVYQTKLQKVLSSAEAHAEETGVFVVDIKTLIQNGSLEADNESGNYIDPRTNRNVVCDIINVIYENSQFYGELSANETCYTEEELESLYGLVDLKLYQDDTELKEVDGWVKGSNIEVKYQLREKYKSYESFIEEIKWSGEVDKSCTKDNLYDCQRYSIPTGEIKSLNVTLELKFKKDGITFTAKVKKMVQIDNQAPYVVKDSITKRQEVSSQQKQKVEFDLSDGEGSGIEEYAIVVENKCDGQEFEDKKKMASETHVTEFLDNGSYYLCVADKVGNRTREATSFTVTNIDTTKPMMKSFTAKSKSETYHSLAVRLNIDVSDDRSTTELKMCISNSGYLKNCSWEPFVSGKDWTINGSLDGKKRVVYISVQDASGNVVEQTTEYQPYKECDILAENKDSFSNCSAACGGGTQTKSYDAKDFFTGGSCGMKTERKVCNTVDCCSAKKISGYGNWKSCSKTCGGGIRYRDVYYVSDYNGQACKTVVNGNSEACNTHGCTQYRYRDILKATESIKSKDASIMTFYQCRCTQGVPTGYYNTDLCLNTGCQSYMTKPATGCNPKKYISSYDYVCSKYSTTQLPSTCTMYEFSCGTKNGVFSCGYTDKCIMWNHPAPIKSCVKMDKVPKYSDQYPQCSTNKIEYCKGDYSFGYDPSHPKRKCVTTVYSCPSGYTLSGTSCYGPWSNWSYNKVAASAFREVETKEG